MKVGIYHGSALSPYLILMVMDELTKGVCDEVSRYTMFTDDVVLVDEKYKCIERRTLAKGIGGE